MWLVICVTSFALRYASRGVAVREHARWVPRAVPFCLLPTSSHLLTFVSQRILTTAISPG